MEKRNILDLEIENECDCQLCKIIKESLIPELENSSVFYLMIGTNVIECLEDSELESLQKVILTVKATEKNHIIFTNIDMVLEKGKCLSKATLEKIENVLNLANFPQVLEVTSLRKEGGSSKEQVINQEAKNIKDPRQLEYKGYCQVVFNARMDVEVLDDGVGLMSSESVFLTKNKEKRSDKSENNLEIFLKKLKEFYPYAEFNEKEIR